MSKKILITGANGFIGSNLVKVALSKKFRVSVLVRKNSNLDNLKKFEKKINIHYGDVTKIDTLYEPISDSEVIFHVAADYRLWSKKYSEIYETNVFGTENILNVVLKFKKKLIYTSSVATLGLKSNIISNEDTPVKFDEITGHYKKSKYLAEKIVLKFVKKKNLDAIIVNPSTPIGPGDIKPTPTGKIILDVLRKKMPAFVETGLNFVHVEDVAIGHLLALKHGIKGEKYLLGGENLEFKEFIDLISDYGEVPKVKMKLKSSYLYFFAYVNEFLSKYIFQSNPNLTVDGLKMSEKKMFFSSEKAKKKLHYRPRPVKDAIKDSIDWMKVNFDTSGRFIK